MHKYKVIEGFNHVTGKPLFHVSGINNEYVGEWHDTKEEAQKELNRM